MSFAYPPSIHTKRTTIVLNATDYCSLSSSARGELLASQYDTHLRFFRARRAGGVVGRGATTYRRIGVCGRNGKSCFVYFELLLLPLLLLPSAFIYFVTFIPPPNDEWSVALMIIDRGGRCTRGEVDAGDPPSSTCTLATALPLGQAHWDSLTPWSRKGWRMCVCEAEQTERHLSSYCVRSVGGMEEERNVEHTVSLSMYINSNRPSTLSTCSPII